MKFRVIRFTVYIPLYTITHETNHLTVTPVLRRVNVVSSITGIIDPKPQTPNTLPLGKSRALNLDYGCGL